MMDELTYKCLGFEMKNGENERKEMMLKLEKRIKYKLQEPAKRVEVFEARNGVKYVNRNVMSVILFYSGTIIFTLGWLDRIDGMIHQHLTKQGMRMKRGVRQAAFTRVWTSWKCGSRAALRFISTRWPESSTSSGEPSSEASGSGEWTS